MEQSCPICGENHSLQKCDFIKMKQHVPDCEIPSTAKLTVPDFLDIQKLLDGSHSVLTKLAINKGTSFGPLLAKKTEILEDLNDHPLKIFPVDACNSEYFLDVSDEHNCNWLIFVPFAQNADEQNLICYQDKDDIYYTASKNIKPGQYLKVWYSPFYAKKMDKSLLKTELEIETELNKNINISELVKQQQNILDRDTWTCKFCSHVLDDVVVFAKHICNHYLTQLKRNCEICKRFFRSKKTLEQHYAIAHKPYPSLSPTKSLKSTKSASQSNDPDYGLGDPLLNDVSFDYSVFPQDLMEFDLDLDNQNLLLETDTLNAELLNENVKDFDHFNFDIADSQKQFVCDICLKQFSKITLLIIHLKLHTGEFTCLKCKRVFCRKENLTWHSCNKRLKYACSLCDKEFSQKKYMVRHINGAHNKKYKCQFCEKIFHENKELREHNCPSRKVEREMINCPQCDKQFHRNKHLKKHLITHIGKKPSVIICDICGVKLSTRGAYNSHFKMHLNPEFLCTICDKKFYRKDMFKEHQNSHSSVPKFDCDQCGKRYKSVRNLQIHQKSHNLSDSPQIYTCPKCNVKFKHRSSVNRHIQTAHEPRKPDNPKLACPICNKSIALKSSLKRHLHKIHNSEIHSLEAAPTEELQNDFEMKNDVECDEIKNRDPQTEEAREVCLSIPDLNEHDQEITLDQNAYILDNGTIVQPQNDFDNFVIYVLEGSNADC